MRKTMILAALVSGALLAAPACKKAEEGQSAGKATEPAKADPAATKPGAEPTTPEPAKPMTPEEKAAFVQACWGHFNSKNKAELQKCYAADATGESVDSGMPASQGAEAIVGNLERFWTAFPDGKGEQALTIVNGNKVVVVALFTGTHSGDLAMGPNKIPATSKKVGYLMGQVLELGDDNLVHAQRIYVDQGTLMGQLGLHPMPVRPVMDKLPAPGEVVIAKDDDTERANVDAYKKMTEAWNAKDTKALAALTHDDVVSHDATMDKDTTGAKELQKNAQLVWKGFPDSKGEVKDVFAAGSYTVAEVQNTGTNTGDVKEWKMKKTGKPLSFAGLDIVEWDGGKMKEAWMFADGMAMMQQLGMAPPMPGAGDAAKATEGGAAPAGDATKPAEQPTK